MVGEWAYVKELATMNTKEGGEWGSIRQYVEGKCSERQKRGSVHSEENEEKCDQCSSFLTGVC